MKKYILTIAAVLLAATAFCTPVPDQKIPNDSTFSFDKDTLAPTSGTSRSQKVAQRNFHYNILGGPSYTPDFGAVLGGSALMTFRMNPEDSTQLRSEIGRAHV